ncbi:prostaglandin E2 receptor EP4 subtype-like [Saccostrea echinata]|uniref:prostaglandin E2 receptor EP4 subtype-like n=1 Tax=Saccostrea echinata TaxID=191078 RepID=UPI002A82AF17|nr:prostaglandin E2 receptor EP4 subtype-like [Saccostrea echinata]
MEYLQTCYNKSSSVNASNTTDMFLSTPSSATVISMFVCGVFGNLLAIFVLVKTSKRHKWKNFYRLVGVLSITDLFGILASTPLVLINYLNNFKWIGGQPTCDYFSFILIFAGLSTIFFISFMSLERFLAVCCPYFYKRQVTKEKVNTVTVLLCLLSAAIAVMPILGFGKNVHHFPGSWCFFDFFGQSTLQNIYSYLYASTGILLISLTAVFNIILVVTLAREIHRKELQDRKSSFNSVSSRRRKRNDIYLMVFLMAILIVFGICYSPLMVRVVLNQSRWTSKCNSCDLLAIRLASFNQILDPWVYILLRRENIICFVKRTKRLKSTLIRSLSSIHSYGSETVAIIRRSLRHRKSSSRDTNEPEMEVNDNLMSENTIHPTNTEHI